MEQKKILVIEDSPYLSDLIKDMLGIKGYEAIIAPSGREAVGLALEHEPDLILLDIRLPDIDGYEVYRRIQESDYGKTANFLVLTASESLEEISKNINLPHDKILFKPNWSVKDLLQKVEEALES